MSPGAPRICLVAVSCLLACACNPASEPAGGAPVGAPEATDAGAGVTPTATGTPAAPDPTSGGAARPTGTGTGAPAPTSTSPAPAADAGARLQCGDRFPACPAGTTCVMGPRVGTCEPKK